MTDDYAMEAPKEEDAEAISHLRGVVGGNVAYYRGYTSPEYYRWKYFSSPIHRSCVRIARENDVLTGIVGATFKRITVGGRTLPCAELGDLLTHPEHRGKKICTRLVLEVLEQLRREGAQFSYGTPNENSYPVVAKLGFEDLFYLRPLVKVLNIKNWWKKKYEGRALVRLGAPVNKVLTRVVFRNARVALPSDVVLSKVPSFDERVNDLWKSTSGSHQVAFSRDQAYLNWRYVEAPREYVIHAATIQEKLIGYIVTHIHKRMDGLVYAYIADLVARDCDLTLMRALASKSVDYCGTEGVDLLYAWVVDGSVLCKALRKASFKPTRRKLYFVVRPETLEAGDLARMRNPDNWYFAMGDTDGI